MSRDDLRLEMSLAVDWRRVRRMVELALEAIAVFWLLTSYRFEAVIPVYQWY